MKSRVLVKKLTLAHGELDRIMHERRAWELVYLTCEKTIRQWDMVPAPKDRARVRHEQRHAAKQVEATAVVCDALNLLIVAIDAEMTAPTPDRKPPESEGTPCLPTGASTVPLAGKTVAIA